MHCRVNAVPSFSCYLKTLSLAIICMLMPKNSENYISLSPFTKSVILAAIKMLQVFPLQNKLDVYSIYREVSTFFPLDSP